MPYVPFHFFRILLTALMLGSQLIVYRFAAKYLTGLGVKRGFTIFILPLIFLIINIPSVFIYYEPQWFISGFARTYVMMPFYAYETFSVAVLLAWLIALPIRSAVRLTRTLVDKLARKPQGDLPSQSRRIFIKNTAIGLGAYTIVGSLHSIYTREEFTIENVALPIKNLPAQLQDLKIAMISDIHAGLYMVEDDMLKYTEALNDLNADIIFIPGDFVTSRTDEIYPFVKAFKGLKSRNGIYTCLGNHDFFGDPDVITDKVRETGMVVLRNQTEELELNGAKLMLSGVDDGRHANFAKVSYEATSLETTRILLCHKPYFFENAVAGKFDVMLSGHTHGGQIVLFDALGIKITPAALASKYISGRYKMGDSTMYVSRGIGTVGLPVRVNCPPEITVFNLVKKS